MNIKPAITAQPLKTTRLATTTLDEVAKYKKLLEEKAIITLDGKLYVVMSMVGWGKSYSVELAEAQICEPKEART